MCAVGSGKTVNAVETGNTGIEGNKMKLDIEVRLNEEQIKLIEEVIRKTVIDAIQKHQRQYHK